VTPPHVPAFVITGAGPWGRQMCDRLLRARAAGRLRTERIVVVDRDARRLEETRGPDGVETVESDWGEWLDGGLDALGAGAQLVPWHWAPHLLSRWLRSHLERAGAEVTPGGVPAEVGTPFEAATASGDRALSYATWMCPPSCIEPDLCPHTRGARDWSLAGVLAAPDRVVLPCLHLVWGVGTVPVDVVVEARDRLVARLRDRPAFDVEVATASHCHGVLARMHVSRPLR
jgi:hypothetical protein